MKPEAQKERLLDRCRFPPQRFFQVAVTYSGLEQPIWHALLVSDFDAAANHEELISICGGFRTTKAGLPRIPETVSFPKGSFFNGPPPSKSRHSAASCAICYERAVELYPNLDQAEVERLTRGRRGAGRGLPTPARHGASFTNKHPAQARLWKRALEYPEITPNEITADCDIDVEWRCTVRGHPDYVDQPQRVSELLKEGNPCPLCREGLRPKTWTRNTVIAFVESMLEHIEQLTPADRYQLLLQTGLLSSSGLWATAVTDGLLRATPGDTRSTERVRELIGDIHEQRDLRERIGSELGEIAGRAMDESMRKRYEKRPLAQTEEEAADERRWAVFYQKQEIAALSRQVQEAGRERAVAMVLAELSSLPGRKKNRCIPILRAWFEERNRNPQVIHMLWQHLPEEGSWARSFRERLLQAFPELGLESIPILGLTTPGAVIKGWKRNLDATLGTLTEAELEAELTPDENRSLVPDSVEKILSASDALPLAGDDSEAVEYFLASQLSKLWTIAFDDLDTALADAERWSGTAFGNTVRDRFLEECVAVSNLPLPDDWSFRPKGAPAYAAPFAPRTMQKLTAVRLRDTDRQGIGNWSLMGGGKTVSAILASDSVESCFTLVVCPNITVEGWRDEISRVFPSAIATDGWHPPPAGERRFMVLNVEKFQQPDTPSHIQRLLNSEVPSLVVLDEIHQFKQRDKKLKRRRENLLAFLTMAKESNPNLRILGMSGTPVINNLYEARSLIELCTLKSHEDLETKPTIANAMRIHARLATLGIRYRPNYLEAFDEIDRVRKDISRRYDDLIGKDLYGTELVCLEEKLPLIAELATKRTVIYSELVDKVHEDIARALRSAGRSIGFYSGERKDGLRAYQDGKVDCLIASHALGTGVDGLQTCSDQLIIATLPWTSSGFDQLLGRFFRPKSDGTVGNVKVRVPWTFIPSDESDGEWSMDRARWLRIRYKASLADAAVDGVLPHGELRTPAQAHANLQAWLKRLQQSDDVATREREDLRVPLPDSSRARIARRVGDLTAFHARVASSKSKTTHERLKSEPEEWFWYHTEAEEAAKSWPFVPSDRCIEYIRRRVSRRPGLVVADIGCGIAKIADAVGGECTVLSFDHVAVDDRVQRANVCDRLPLDDESVDLAVLSLVLDWQRDWEAALVEAARVLALDGQLVIWETRRFVEARAKGIESLTELLTRYSLKVLQVFDEHFVGIVAVKL